MNIVTFVIGNIVSVALMIVAWIFVPSVWGPFRFLDWAVVAIIYAVIGVLGYRKNEVGFNAALLFFGARIGVTLSEGWFWVGPFPFILSFIPIDVRDRRRKLNGIEILSKEEAGEGEEGEAIKLNVDEGSIFFRVTDVNRYLSIGPQIVEDGLDDLFDDTMRKRARQSPMNKILGSEFLEGVEDEFHTTMRGTNDEEGHGVRWGIEIVKVALPSILPDKDVLEAIELRRKEEAERDGQKVELEHFRSRMTELIAVPPAGPGLTREQAYELLQVEILKVPKTIAENKFEIGQQARDATQGVADVIRDATQGVADVIARAIAGRNP